MTAPVRLHVPAIDTLTGERLTDVTVTSVPHGRLQPKHAVKLGCGCTRYAAERPGGGLVHLLTGTCTVDGRHTPDATVVAA